MADRPMNRCTIRPFGACSALDPGLSSPQQFVMRHPWLSASAALAIVQIASSGALEGRTLSSVADVIQLGIMALMVVGTAINIPRSRGHARAFWTLMTVSAGMWIVDYAMWVYYEIVRQLPMPIPQAGDTFLILHVVPLMMALALLPHRVQRKSGSVSSHVGLALIACWWVYLYFQFAFVWQYIHFDAPSFHRNFNLVYHAELASVILALFFLSKHSEKGWQEIFQHYLIAFLIYAPTSAIINILIQEKAYQSGGLWDVPLTVSISYLAWIGFRARSIALEASAADSSSETGLSLPEWAASLAGAAIPAIALFSFERLHDPPGVGHFRIALGFSSMLLIALLLFTRQYLLNRSLATSLAESRQAYQSLERLQTQVMQSEKLASIGRLVSGAAHELNNPLTAILGYSDLISGEPSVPETQRSFAEKIAQQARRTKNLVSNLLSFARQTPAQKRLTDLNVMIHNACQLQLASFPAKVSLIRDLQPDLPQIMGDDNHLLQVFLQVLKNAIDAVEEVGGGEIAVRTYARGDDVVLEVRDSGPGITEPARVFDPFYTTKPPGQGTGLGLSACYGIIQEHEGTIECSNLAPRGALFRITLKAAGTPEVREAAAVS
jgi:signal transduction histidine kinase